MNKLFVSPLAREYDRFRANLQTLLESTTRFGAATIKLGVGLAGVLALSVAVREAIEVVRLNSAESLWAIDISCGYLCPKVRIAIAMIIIVGCLFSLSSTRLLIAAFPFGWIVGEYVYWLSRSLKVKQYYDSLGVYQWPEGRTLGLVGATWWDILLMFLTVLLLAWWMKAVCSALYSLHIGRPKKQLS